MDDKEYFKEALNFVLHLEGGLKLHKNITESETTYAGIYRKSNPDWPGWAFIDRGEKVPFQLVEEFYYDNYWLKFSEVKDVVKKLCLFESAVNLGVTMAIKLAQITVDTTTDGILGPHTLLLINDIDSEKFIYKFLMYRISFYHELVSKRPDRYKVYFHGWVKRVIEVLSWLQLYLV